ncbi:glycoside hydrolase family 2 TIM barrel-domain containing protein [Luteimonas sp BLCC-B24]|uniref:glycoside hydrolase family 2 TIM barrel-domain containing protein n=1 Tax=Luteimonas sp. BLCC-B24 TaxID=3025317 RepID=UPI00234C2E24|nr:glycoside hydrolase family 2 TIM barrel-domain containing protein [Luteimonas sp. BLCC-B24]MDC7808370.1 glycoside hydrolase family 2 TIM barrel-domain containing protein [Luteimonas sp. BLCC-B24]
MRITSYVLALLCSAAVTAPVRAAPDSPVGVGPAQVRVVQDAGVWQLTVDGAPFRVRGAGLSGGDIDALAQRGGNAFRTWSTGLDRARVTAMLDRAHRNGLRVAMGLEVGKERHGFDYDDADAVAAQLARIREEVTAYRAHPAVLMWLVGNELNLEARNPKVWDAVNAIAEAIHAIDPDHPVMTPLAGFDAALIAELKARAPALDLIGVQLYGDIEGVQTRLRDAGWTGAYIVTEWGPTGHWESPETAWGAPIEDDATRKAALLAERYARDIDSDRTQGLGSFVFLWGQKQERTPTWYGLFLASGESTPGVDTMQRLWTGAWPANRAPAITPLRIDGRTALDSVTLAPGTEHTATVDAHDADGDTLTYRWVVREESTATTIGGDPESLPAAVELRIADAGTTGTLRFTAPAAPGHYRLFVEVHDGQGHAAYANLPFRVAGAAQD